MSGVATAADMEAAQKANGMDSHSEELTKALLLMFNLSATEAAAKPRSWHHPSRTISYLVAV